MAGSIDLDDEAGASHAKERGWRFDPHRIPVRFRDLPGDDGQ
jgi:hypothetical protein